MRAPPALSASADRPVPCLPLLQEIGGRIKFFSGKTAYQKGLTGRFRLRPEIGIHKTTSRAA
eukprot:8259128-Pyramimonas_sp.AAC.1